MSYHSDVYLTEPNHKSTYIQNIPNITAVIRSPVVLKHQYTRIQTIPNIIAILLLTVVLKPPCTRIQTIPFQRFYKEFNNTMYTEAAHDDVITPA